MTQPVKWPENARCAIMMTFDLDGESPWIHRDPALAERPLRMSMGAYGPKTSMPRILQLLDRYGIKTCFFIPGWIVERYPALCEDIVRRGHEVGHHGYLHEKPFFLSGREEEEALLVKSLDIFKRVLGATPLGARAPAADPSAHTMELLKKHGFLYHSNALGDLVRGVRRHVRGGRLLQLARPSAGRRPAVAHAHGRAPHPEDPRQEGRLVAEARRARPVLARAEPGPRGPLMGVGYTAAREERLMKLFARCWAVAALLIFTWAPAAPAQQPVNLAFATLDSGSAWYVYGATIAELLRKTLPPGSNIDVKPRAGGVGNPRLVAKNETPLGLSFTVTNRWAWEGKEAYDTKLDNLRALAGGLDTYYLVAVVSKKLPINSLKEMKDKKMPVRLVSQPVGSLGEFAARQLLRAEGLTYADLKGWGGSTAHVGYNIIVDSFRDGRVDMLIAVITAKHPSVNEIATSSDVKFLGLDDETIRGLAPLGYTPATMPANTFKGQTEPVKTVGFPTVVITNKELPEAIAYTVTKTIIENKDALVRGHAGLQDFDPATAWQPAKVGLPLHAGAERAYREKGWMK
jgi:uncharacterized protein